MLKQRCLTALIGIPVVFFFLYAGGLPFAMALVVLSFVAMLEFAHMIKALGHMSSPLAAFMPGVYLTGLFFLPSGLTMQLFTALIVVLLLRQLWQYPEFGFPALAAATLSVAYTALLFGNVWSLRHVAGFPVTLLALLSIWGFDSFAYFAGVTLGRVRPWPLISPKKSVEGTVAGFAGSLLVWIAGGHVWLAMPLWSAVVLALGSGFFSLTGDLVESALKRSAGVKDSGSLFPGHGGVLDRLDSILFGCTFVYWFWMVTM